MFCGKCGKQIPNTTKFCPYCGAQTAPPAPAPQGNFRGGAPGRNTVKPLSPSASANLIAGMGLFRLILIICGAVQVLFFFVLSYGRLESGRLASILGFDVPARLTGLNAIRVAGDDRVGQLIVAAFFLLPVILGAIVLLLNCTGKRRGSYITSIVLSAITVIAYIIIYAMLATVFEWYYSITGISIILAFLVTFVQLGFSIAGCAADPRVKRMPQQYP